MLISVMLIKNSVYFRGMPSGPKKAAFRAMYGRLVELKEMLSPDTRLVMVTATATKNTIQTVLATLGTTPDETLLIHRNPVKKNIFYRVRYISKDEPRAVIFNALIEKFKSDKTNLPRTLIFCPTRQICSLLYNTFLIELGETAYCGSKSPENRMVDMYHAGIGDMAKRHIERAMGIVDHHLKIIICTIAFGMGIDIRGVHTAIHFGPPGSIEQLMQEGGRIGRDGQPSSNLILFNGYLQMNVESDMRKFLNATSCRREILFSKFNSDTSDHEIDRGCCCCDICASSCDCGSCRKETLLVNRKRQAEVEPKRRMVS